MIELMNTTIADRDIHIDLKMPSAKIPKYVSFDKRRLQQVLLNLLSNSIKYSHRGRITVFVFILKRMDGQMMLNVQVQDEGIGLNEDELENMFKPFASLSNRSRSQSKASNGFGLSVCKLICQQLDGNIIVERNFPVGAIFTFTMKVEIIQLSKYQSKNFREKGKMIMDQERLNEIPEEESQSNN